MEKKKILIIGGAGFIGINSAKKFIEDGCQVTIFDNLSRNGTDKNMKWLETEYAGKYDFIRGDVRFDQELLAQAVEASDAVLHLAAQVAVTTSVADPRTDFEINALGTLNVLEAIRKSEKKPLIIYTSTNKVYGDLERSAVKEEDSRYALLDYPAGVPETYLLDFHSPYGCSKGAADQYVRDYARIYGLKTVVLRQSCIYGRHQFGIEDQGWIAWFIIAHLTGRPISLYGNGKQVRDVLFVDDLVNLYQKLIDKIETVAGKIYNVGGGMENSISLLEFIQKLKKNHDFDIRHEVKETRPGDQKVFVSDNQKLADDLGWSPTVGVDEGIDKLVKWVQENLDRIRSLY